MEPRLRITTLGSLQIRHAGAPVSGLASRKAEALLVYLAHTGRAHAREMLAELLWDERSQARAMGNLRVVLASLRQQLEPYLLISRQSVAINPQSDYWMDAAVLSSRLDGLQELAADGRGAAPAAVAALEEALELYRGEFLEGFYLSESQGFEAWASQERERLRQGVLDALKLLGHWQREHGDLLAALAHARRLLQLDPLDEEGHRLLMQLLAESGQRRAALSQYERCRQLLLDELGLEPEEATVQLYTRIQAGALESAPSAPARQLNLPLPATSFVGRSAELAQLLTLLRRPACRLVTLAGPGGSGKTRLALRAAEQLQDDFAHGVVYVALAALSDPKLVQVNIASALKLPLSSADGRGQQLIERLKQHLHQQQLLLVLDNFEQLLPAVPLLSELLDAAPGLKLLVTSRAVLHLSAEQVFAVPPLRLPELRQLSASSGEQLVATLGQYDAPRLFVERAQALRPGFAVSEQNAATIAAICQRLDGLPLAIELAAARVRLLSPQALLARLDRRLALLTGGARDLPARQQTLRATIDWSYRLLDTHEQQIFQRLGIFVGGCTLEAAEVICAAQALKGGATPSNAASTPGHASASFPGRPASSPAELAILDILASLLDKSLLQQSEAAPGGRLEPRFSLLETIREYALERLAESGELEALQWAHARYYLALVETAEPALTSARRGPWLERLAAEHDNLRAVLAWSREAAPELGLRLAAALDWFWIFQGHLREAQSWIESLLPYLPRAHDAASRDVQRLRARVLLAAGRVTNDSSLAVQWLQESVQLYRTQGEQPMLAHALCALAYPLAWDGQPEQAIELLDETVALFRQLGDDWGLANSLARLAIGQAFIGTGRYDRREQLQLLQESSSLWHKLGDQWGMSQTLLYQAWLSRAQGEEQAARALAEQSLTLAQAAGDRWLVAGVLLEQAETARYQANYQQAAELYEQSLALYRELGDAVHMARILHTLGWVSHMQGDDQRARRLCQESLDLARAANSKGDIAFALRNLAYLAQQQGDYDQALRDYHASLTAFRANKSKLGAMLCLSGIADCLAGLADQPGRDERLRTATLLLAASDMLLEELGVMLMPADRAAHEAVYRQLRARPGEGQFAAAWAAGQALGLSEAVELALKAAQPALSNTAEA